MAVQIQLRRGTAAQWVADNPTLAEGEIGLENDTKLAKLGDGVTAWNDLEYWPASGAQRLFYDTAISGTAPYPLTWSYFQGVNAASAPELVNDWTQFANGFFLVENFATGEESVHRFTAFSEFADWKNANIPHGGSPDRFTQLINLRPFDIIDDQIPVVKRLYGYPNMYAGWKGGRIKSGYNHMGPGQFGNSVLHAVWAHFFPSQAPFFTVADFGTNQGGRKSCWTSRKSTQLYSMPKRGEIVYIADTTQHTTYRHSANENWEGFNQLDPTDTELTIDDVIYVYVNETMTSWEIQEYPDGEGGKLARQQLLGSGSLAGFTCFKLVGPGSIGDRQIAVLIKPMGIDRIWLPFFDNTKYDMEIVWTVNADQQPTHFKKIPWAEFNSGSGSAPHPNSGMFLKKQSFLDHSSRFGIALWHMKTANKQRAYFRLRSKATGKVGRLSEAHIEVIVGATNAPVKIMVVQD